MDGCSHGHEANSCTACYREAELAALRARVAELEAERDLAAQRWGESLGRHAFTKQWYAERLHRLRKLADDNGLTTEHCSIVANGTATIHEPPTYAQQFNMALHQVEKRDEEIAKLTLQSDQLRERAERAEATVARVREALKVEQLKQGRGLTTVLSLEAVLPKEGA